MNYPFVSIVILSYNNKKFIAKAIDSCLQQTFQNIEIIISDDNSQDGSQDLIKSYIEKFPTKIIANFQEENEGITKNSNKALSLCKGKYVVFMGSDDILSSNKIERQIKWFEDNPSAVLCGHCVDIIDENDDLISSPNYLRNIFKNNRGNRKFIEKGHIFCALSIMYKRDDSIMFDERLKFVSDGKFSIDILKNGQKWGGIKEVLGFYRQHSNNFTKSYELAEKDIFMLYEEILPKEYPEKLKFIRTGKSFVYYYGNGVRKINQKSYSQAINFFFASIKLDFLQWKSYIRILECFIKKILEKLY